MAVVDEVDAYSASVAGVRLEAVRTGHGIGPHRVLSLRDDRFLFTSNDIGFPFRSTATVSDEQVVIAVIIETPPGARWCSIDLEPDTVLVYGPGVEHTANNLAGARVAWAFFDLEQMDDLAERHQAPITPLSVVRCASCPDPRTRERSSRHGRCLRTRTRVPAAN